MAHKILIVEDDLRIASLLEKGLAQHGYHTQLAYDGTDAIALLESNSFDLMITDIVMPKIDGVALVKWLREQNSWMPVIMLTALGTTNQKVGGFDAGADDYMVKPFEMKELIARVQVLLKRTQGNQQNPSPQILTFDEVILDMNKKLVTRAGENIELTPKEYDLFLYFMKHPERVLNREEIAREVWHTHFDTGTNYIDVYISYLRQKIDKPFSYKLIHTKTGMGFILQKES